MDPAGKRVLITGAGRGLGHTLVSAFADAGAREILAGVRKAQDLERLRDEGKAGKSPITPVKLDVTVDEDVQAVSSLGPVDILVNNAGIAVYGNPLSVSFEEIQRELAVNYLGVLRMVRAVAPGMRQLGQGAIVNIGSILGKINLPMVGTYCATKAALLSLGQALRAYLKQDNIHVITVLPGTIDTDMSSGADVPKMTREFVAAEILKAIKDEAHDPIIGEEAQGLLAGLNADPLGLERTLAEYRS